MFLLQNVIHFLEEGRGGRFFRILLAALVFLVLALAYDFNGFRNFATMEAMDSAQLGRNIAEGRGYSTMFIRPLSLHLVHQRNQDKADLTNPSQTADLGKLQDPHPDISNPPVFPCILAGLFKLLPFQYSIDTTHSFWSRIKNPTQREFWRYQPDFLIAVFNQLLFVGVITLVFKLAKRLFDTEVAWLSTALLVGSEVFWRFTSSGLSTIFLLLLIVTLALCIIQLDEELHGPMARPWRVVAWASLCGVLVGLGALTRYSFGWLIIPVILFLISCGGKQKAALSCSAFVCFAVLLAPWVARNYAISGLPFGTASYTVVETTPLFPEHTLQRTLEPDFSRLNLFGEARRKLVNNVRQIVQTELPKLGGSWISAFFLAGIMVGYKNPTTMRLRYFLLSCIVTLTIVQALGRTQLTEDSPEINSENMLVLLAPLVIVYGASLFYLLVDRITLPFLQIRYVIVGLFAALASLPLLLVFFPPRTPPIAYPPYYPPAIQQVVGWTKPDELIMSDIPWAVAWYGQSQSVWLTLDCQSSFLAINDFQKPVHALYISRVTLDAKFLSQWVRAGDKAWGQFILNCLFRKTEGKNGPPPGFPLQFWQSGWPDQFFLTFREHWPKSQ